MKWKFRHVVKLAHILKNDLKSFSLAMKKAWKFFKIRNLMKTNIVSFEFLKSNGELRKCKGTHCFDNIPKNKRPRKQFIYFLDLIRFYDVEINDWRSFKAEQLC